MHLRNSTKGSVVVSDMLRVASVQFCACTSAPTDDDAGTHKLELVDIEWEGKLLLEADGETLNDGLRDTEMDVEVDTLLVSEREVLLLETDGVGNTDGDVEPLTDGLADIEEVAVVVVDVVLVC